LRIDVLGPIEVARGNQKIPLAGQRQRALVAALALEHGKVVAINHLVDVLWDTSPPPTARAKIQAHVSALRQAIGQDAPGAAGPLLTQPPGYLLRLREAELDLAEFETLTQKAREAAGQGRQTDASELFGTALALWHGSAFADVESPIIRAAATALEEMRLLAREGKAEVDLALGNDETVVVTLSTLLLTHPFRERLRALLMLALYRLGCRADALTVYRKGRRMMVAELGIEPGPQLRRLHQRILADDPALYNGARRMPQLIRAATQPPWAQARRQPS
jgi:DNA-binding SARP family transcriptional activator